MSEQSGTWTQEEQLERYSKAGIQCKEEGYFLFGMQIEKWQADRVANFFAAHGRPLILTDLQKLGIV